MPRPDTSRRTRDAPTAAALETAAGYVSTVRGAPDRVSRLRAAADRQGLAAVRQLAVGLPVVEARFSDDPHGTELRAWFTLGRAGLLRRAPVAVLALPGEPAEYLRGRQRQALRTNLTKAAAAGVTCAAVADAAEVRRAVAHVAAARQQDPATMVPDRAERRVRSRFTVAFDRTGTPVALAETVLDGAWAGLATLVTAHTGVAGFDADSEARQVVRYQLHSAVVGELIGQGVERLTVAGSMLLTPTGTRYFQRRTGYEPVRLRIPSVGRDRSSVPAE